MFANRSALALALCAVAPLALTACVSSDQEEDEVAQIRDALELDNGGMDTGDEAPAFGDDHVAATPELVATFADATDVTSATMLASGAAKFHVVLTWGHLPKAHDQSDSDVDPQPVDWTGDVRVDAGAIGLLRTLKFDAHDGVLPRQNAQQVDFVSHTLPAVDGLLLQVAIPPNGARVLHVETAALTTDIDLDQLAHDGGALVPLGDGRNGLAAMGYADVPGCARGFLFGRWVKLQGGVGKLRGRVVAGNGDPLGHVKGIWGHAPKKDENRFFGKYIDQDGDFRGLFGGTYGGGAFHGKWGTVDPADHGTLEGRYSDGFDIDDGRGFYVGRWSEKCGAN